MGSSLLSSSTHFGAVRLSAGSITPIGDLGARLSCEAFEQAGFHHERFNLQGGWGWGYAHGKLCAPASPSTCRTVAGRAHHGETLRTRFDEKAQQLRNSLAPLAQTVLAPAGPFRQSCSAHLRLRCALPATSRCLGINLLLRRNARGTSCLSWEGRSDRDAPGARGETGRIRGVLPKMRCAKREPQKSLRSPQRQREAPWRPRLPRRATKRTSYAPSRAQGARWGARAPRSVKANCAFASARQKRNWLGYQDSNLDSRLQRPESCHWTIPQLGRRPSGGP